MTLKHTSNPAKAKVLHEEGTLNPAPQKVNDPSFLNNEFFDPLDVVQVRYEMLRRVRVENVPVTDATEQYGVSRPTFYLTLANFDTAGIAGLVPQKRGPRGPHKLHPEVLDFLEKHAAPGEPIRARKLAELIREKFDLDIHPRTIERMLAGKKTSR